MDSLRAATVQFQHVPGDKSRNLEIVSSFVQQAASQDVNLIVFPECCLSGYWHLRHLPRKELVDLAEPIPDGHCSARLLEIAAEFNLTIGAGLVEVAADGTLF